MRRSAWLSRETGTDVYLKLETLQPSYSYKIRGAWNAVLALGERGGAAGLVTASAGNHGRALAHAAGEVGLPLTVFVPSTAPRVKVDAIRQSGARLRECASYDEAEQLAKREAAESGAVYISPYADQDVIAGAGTVGLEILEERPDVSEIVAPVGGGGLISGIAAAVSEREVALTGVEAEASSPFTQGLAAGRIVRVEVHPTLADGLAGNLDPDTITFEIVRRRVGRIALVSEDEIRRAISMLVAEERLLAEGAAATAVAAVLAARYQSGKGQTLAVVLTGANIDLDTLRTLI